MRKPAPRRIIRPDWSRVDRLGKLVKCAPQVRYRSSISEIELSYEMLSIGGSADLIAMPLRAIGAARGLNFGSAMRFSQLLDPAYRGVLEFECGTIVPENELKMSHLCVEPGAIDFTRSDILVDYALLRGLDVRGHTLVWHHPKWMPSWLETVDFGSRPADFAARMVQDYVRTVCEHYRGRIFTWDVVNEAVDNKSGGFRETALSEAIGDPEVVLDLAFRAARDTLPGCELVYNDYMNWDTPAHRSGVLRLLEGFRKRGTPVNALGLQCHIAAQNGFGRSGFDAEAERAWRTFLDEVTAMGYELEITEFDVNDSDIEGDFLARDGAVAEVAGAFLDCTLSYASVKTLMLWGLASDYSWLQTHRNGRADRAPLRCCPYGPDLRPLLLRERIANALHNCRPR